MSDSKQQPNEQQSVADIIRFRRTIHDFQPELPPREIIRQAIDLARWAPNHLLTEPWHFYLLGPQTKAAVVQLNAEIVAREKGSKAAQEKFTRWQGIPGWIAVTCDQSDDSLRAREDFAACCCAVQNLSLYLWSQGIGVKWTTGAVIREAAFYDLIWVDPELETVVGLLWYGYPADIPQTPRKPIEQILVELP